MSAWAIVVAAGCGSRFGGDKQSADLGGRRVVDWSIAAANQSCSGVVVVIPPGSPGFGAEVEVEGGATRSESVRRGLGAVPDDAEVIAVHDGARPLATTELFAAVIDAVRSGADGAVPGLPVADALQRVEGDEIAAPVDRSGLVAVQTPQAFRAAALRDAHAGGADAADDAALVVAGGGRVVVVPGQTGNVKITTAADLELARAQVAGRVAP